MRRRDFIKYTGSTAVTSSALAGCSHDDAPSNGTPASNETGGRSSLSRDNLKVGVLAPNPKSFNVGEDYVNGAKLAADKINQSGGTLGANLELVIGNTKLSPATALQEHRRLTVKENCDVTVGVFFGRALKSVMESVAQQETLHITAGSADNSSLKKVRQNYDKYKYQFRTFLNFEQVNLATKTFIENNFDRFEWDSAAVFTEDIKFMDPMGQPFVDKIKAAGVDVQMFERTSTGITNWTPLFDRVEAQGVDILFVFLVVTGVNAAAQWGAEKRPFEFGGINVFSLFRDFWENTGGFGEFTWSMNIMTPQTSNTPHTQPFVQEYTTNFGRAPSFGAPSTYDAVNVYHNAVRETGSLRTSELIPYLENDLVYKESPLHHEIDFMGPDGRWPHDPSWTGLQAEGIPIYMQWQEGPDGNGVMESFAPESNKTGEYQKPPWL